MEPEYRELIARSGLADVLNVHGYVPYLKTLSMMKSYDALLLVDAPLTTASESVFLPSKLIDYLGSGTPILAVTPSHGATARVVRETGGAVCPLETPQALDDFFLEALPEPEDPPATPRERGGPVPLPRGGSILAGDDGAVRPQDG